LLRFLKTGIQLSKTSFFLVSIFFFAFYEIYYFLLTNFLDYVIPFGLEIDWLRGILYFFTVLVLFFSGFLIKKFNKLKIIYFCSIFNSIFSILIFGNFFEGFQLIILFFLVSFMSLGMLSTLGIFGSITLPEERGRVGGLIGFVVFLLFYIVNYLIVLNIDFFGSVVFCLLFSLLPLVGLLFKHFPTKLLSIKKHAINYYERRVAVLYFIPWILFSVFNSTLASNSSDFIRPLISDSVFFSLLTIQVTGVVFGVLLGGFIADLLGRRFSLVFSLTLYGFGSALLGLFENELVYIGVYAISGLSWGFLFVLYIFVVWGDLSHQKERLQLYSIGLISFFISLGIGSLVRSLVYESLSLFQSALLSVMLIFILNIPILFAPELLPSYILEKIRMKHHMDRVKKLQKKNQG
jgi:MFS family permease